MGQATLELEGFSCRTALRYMVYLSLAHQSNWSSILAIILLTAPAEAQNVSEKNSRVFYTDSSGKHVSLGAGFSPQLTREGKVALIRGRLFSYGEPSDCRQKNLKNWIAVYDPVTRSEKVLFDRALSFGRKGLAFCIFEQMQLSPDDSMLYLVSPVYATSGSLAIITLASGSTSYVHGVMSVFVIESGPHTGELIYERRRLLPVQGPSYPYVHARPDGSQIKVIGEDSSNGIPRVKSYLRKIDAQIRFNGVLIP